MRFRNTLILLLVLVGLAAYVYFVEYPASEREGKKKTLFEFSTDDVTALTLAYPDREIALKKADGHWRLERPLQAEADESAVTNLLRTIAECEVKKTVEEEPSDLAKFGLDAPASRIRVTLKDRELPEIRVGKTTPIGYSAYIQRADEKKVLLTTGGFRTAVDKKVKDLRDKTVLQIAEESEVHKIRLEGEGRAVTLERKDGQWRLVEPIEAAADPATVRSFLATVRSLRAVDFPDDNPSELGKYGLDAPRRIVTVWQGKENDQRQLLLGKENEQKQLFVKAGNRPNIYAVSDWVYRDLDKNPTDFRDKTVLAFDKDKARSIEVRRSDGNAFKLVRTDGDQWTVENAPGKVAQTRVNYFVSDLHDLKGYDLAAEGSLDWKSLGLDPPALAITVRGEGDAEIGTAWIGQREREGKKEYTAARANGNVAFLIRDYLYTRLDKRVQDFVEQPTPTPTQASAQAETGGQDQAGQEGEIEEEGIEGDNGESD